MAKSFQGLYSMAVRLFIHFRTLPDLTIKVNVSIIKKVSTLFLNRLRIFMHYTYLNINEPDAGWVKLIEGVFFSVCPSRCITGGLCLCWPHTGNEGQLDCSLEVQMYEFNHHNISHT